jgi:cell division protein FtsW
MAVASRLDTSPVATWWWTIDRWFLAAFLSLMGLGIVLSFAASPAVAERIGLEPFHFVDRQIVYMLMSAVVLIGVSFFSIRQVRRLGLLMLVVTLAMMVATLYFGMEVKGSRRWLYIAGMSIQPSEYLKPAFVIVCAWLFAEHQGQPEIPGNLFAIILLGVVLALLVAQPDLGQTMLVLATWGAMFFIAGLPWLWIAVLGALGVGGGFAAYAAFTHVSERIDRFLTGQGDTYQVDMGLEALVRGGWFGQGPGEGTVKRILPDSHTDFVFSVAGEEFGLILCFFIVGLFAFVVLRGLMIAHKEEDAFTRYALSGLVIVFGLQSIINIAVNIRLMPAKGMTLPFISYGGSSLMAMGISMGMVLALSRRKPQRRFSARSPALPAEAAPAG